MLQGNGKEEAQVHQCCLAPSPPPPHPTISQAARTAWYDESHSAAANSCVDPGGDVSCNMLAESMCGCSVEVATDVVAVRGDFPDTEQEEMPVGSVSGLPANCQCAEPVCFI
jgi:hypothetical protein